MMEQYNPENQIDSTDSTGLDDVYHVILFNDDYHTFDDVIFQIIKATRCSRTRAEELTWEVHKKGKATVFDGDLTNCLKVSAILEEIELHTQIES